MTVKPLKAYTVLEHDEHTGDIYFARHAIVAHKAGANEFGYGELTNVGCRRAPEFDKYAESGHVPWAARIDHGWHIDCSGCGVRISDDEYDTDDEPIEFNVIEIGHHVFCSPDCHETHKIEKAEEAHIKAAVVGNLIDKIMRTVPGAVICGHQHVYVRHGAWPRPVEHARVEFMFPGGRYPAGLRFDKVGEKPRFFCAAGDRIAFYRWRDAGYPPAMMDAPE